MNRPNSPYQRFVEAESKPSLKRDYCYATGREQHASIFQSKTLLDLKNWRANCRKMLQSHIDNNEHLRPEYAEKCSNLASRIELLDEEIDRREAVWTPRNPKAENSLWRAKLKLMDEREAKRQRTEEPPSYTSTTPRPQPLGYNAQQEKEKYAANVLEEKFTFNCPELLSGEEEGETQVV